VRPTDGDGEPTNNIIDQKIKIPSLRQNQKKGEKVDRLMGMVNRQTEIGEPTDGEW